MPQTARSYLLDRFRTDAVALRQRADAMAVRSAAPVPGPDATMSRRMAVACDRVVAMLDAVPDADDGAQAIATLVALVPLLEQHAAQEASAPPVRAVYIGAATRIREVHAAESRAVTAQRADSTMDADGEAGDDGDHDADSDVDESERASDADDEDADDDIDDDADDDIDDDDLHQHDDEHDDKPDAPSPPGQGPRS